MCSFEITRQIKNVISSLLQCLWTSKLAVWGLRVGDLGFAPTKSHDLRDLGWGLRVCTHKVTWSFNHLVLWWQIKYVVFPLPRDQWSPNMTRWWFTVRDTHPASQVTWPHNYVVSRPTSTKLGKVMTYHDRLESIMSYDPLITWPTWGHDK